MKEILIDGQNLSIEQVIAVAYHYAKVNIAPEAIQKVQKSREFIAHQVVSKNLIYAINTGFGSNASEILEDETETQLLQTKLLLSHACGVGANFPTEIVRAIMLIRLNTLLAGYSGIQLQTVLLLLALINQKIHPIIPSQGSVGASGDLCPLSHMALALIGEGEVEIENISEGKIIKQKIPAREALKIKGLQPISLKYKEGIALNNGTTVMAALGVIAVYEGIRLLKLATLSSCLAFEALCVRKQAFDEKIHQVRRHKEQIWIAQMIRTFTKDSELLGITSKEILANFPDTIKSLFSEALQQEISAFQAGVPKKIFEQVQKKLPDEPQEPRWRRWEALFKFAEKKISPQDAYSVRCTPQILGASLQAIMHAKEIIENELNAVVDNPLIFMEANEVLSGGNFHGQPIALVLDYLKLAFAEMGNVLERQINKLVDAANNDILPPFLVDKSGLNSGYMIPQYVAASLVSENKVLVHPASADSIPTSANQEDHVSMGTIGGRQALEILENVRKIVVILMLTAAQGVDLRLKQLQKAGLNPKLGQYTQLFHEAIRSKVPHLEEDRLLYQEIQLLLASLEEFHQLLDSVDIMA